MRHATLQHCNIGCALRAARCAARAPATRNVARCAMYCCMLRQHAVGCMLDCCTLHFVAVPHCMLRNARSNVACCRSCRTRMSATTSSTRRRRSRPRSTRSRAKRKGVERMHARARAHAHTHPNRYTQNRTCTRISTDYNDVIPPRPFLPPSRPPEPHLAPRAQTPACPPTRPRARTHARTCTHTCTRARMCTGTHTRTRLGAQPLLAGSLRRDSEGLGPRPRALSCGYFEVL